MSSLFFVPSWYFIPWHSETCCYPQDFMQTWHIMLCTQLFILIWKRFYKMYAIITMRNCGLTHKQSLVSRDRMSSRRKTLSDRSGSNNYVGSFGVYGLSWVEMKTYWKALILMDIKDVYLNEKENDYQPTYCLHVNLMETFYSPYPQSIWCSLGQHNTMYPYSLVLTVQQKSRPF